MYLVPCRFLLRINNLWTYRMHIRLLCFGRSYILHIMSCRLSVPEYKYSCSGMHYWPICIGRLHILHNVPGWILLPDNYGSPHRMQRNGYLAVLARWSHYLPLMPSWIILPNHLSCSCRMHIWILCLTGCGILHSVPRWILLSDHDIKPHNLPY